MNDRSHLHLFKYLSEPDVTLDEVRDFFDYWAPEYDAMLQGLDYRGHLFIAALVELYAVRNPVVLDLGCGTGLAGDAMRNIAKTIDGIDISANMLALAKDRGCYARLDQGNFLTTNRMARYDAVTCADAFPYVSMPHSFFAMASACLNQGGILAMLSEESEHPEFGTYTRRYSYPLQMIVSMAKVNGLEMEGVSRKHIRTDSGAPVSSLAMAFRKVPCQTL